MGLSGFGATVTFDGDSIGEVRNVEGPNIERDDIDVSSSDSTSEFKEMVPGLIDPGEITVTALHDPDVDPLAMYAKKKVTAGLVTEFALAEGYATRAKCTQDAYLKSWGPGTPYDGEATVAYTFKTSGVPVFADGSA